MYIHKDLEKMATYRNQQGATLIVVLLVLILVMLVGVAVVRNSSTDLRLATASQIDTVLFISAEQPNAKLEQGASNPTYDLFSETKGMIGYFMNDINEGNANHKLITCFRPQLANPFDYNKMAVFDNKDTLSTSTGRRDKNQKAPFCNVLEDGDYTSERGTTMAQMQVTRGGSSAAGGGRRFANKATGTDQGKGDTKNYSINVEVVSTLPVYSNASNSNINECFELDSGKAPVACLEGLGVPSKDIFQNYIAKFQDNIEEASASSATSSTTTTGGASSTN
ncbi:PilX N-terminal domain-containing pilus assembly protein [Psychrobacter sp. I-STPA10]|uniref:PilX N-terminal domain-containing pilus assembly protein n=1 Tax=Psychrobacter sp. I-STPA10 TaxID=2585769 RepID=UPI001E3DF8FD|nr:PilX N-terminal domain-containing pilus assembly protein [Psychrobacter sp. I-STPA10]